MKANNGNAESKNKRQITQYLRTPGTNEQASIGSHQQQQQHQHQQQPQSQPFEQSEALPLQLSHAIYGQEHGSQVFGRRPTPKSDRQVTETVDEGEQESQQQQQREVFNFIKTIQIIYIIGHSESNRKITTTKISKQKIKIIKFS